MARTGVGVAGGALAASAEGSGQPVLVVQTALSVDELVPLMCLLRDHYRVITFDRRGYGSSASTRGAATIGIDASDSLAVLTALDAVPAHVIGASYSAAVAMRLAADAPAAVRSLTIVEPPPRHVPAAPDFLAANYRLLDIYEREGVAVALETFMTMLVGPDWRPHQEALAPGSVARIERDADAFSAVTSPRSLAGSTGPMTPTGWPRRCCTWGNRQWTVVPANRGLGVRAVPGGPQRHHQGCRPRLCPQPSRATRHRVTRFLGSLATDHHPG